MYTFNMYVSMQFLYLVLTFDPTGKGSIVTAISKTVWHNLHDSSNSQDCARR